MPLRGTDLRQMLLFPHIVSPPCEKHALVPLQSCIEGSDGAERMLQMVTERRLLELRSTEQ